MSILDTLEEKYGNKNLTVHKDEIFTAIAKGYNLKQIWTVLAETKNLKITYSSFVKKVRVWQHSMRKDSVQARNNHQKSGKKFHSSSQNAPKEKKKESIFDNWTGKNLSNKELYGVD